MTLFPLLTNISAWKAVYLHYFWNHIPFQCHLLLIPQGALKGWVTVCVSFRHGCSLGNIFCHHHNQIKSYNYNKRRINLKLFPTSDQRLLHLNLTDLALQHSITSINLSVHTSHSIWADRNLDLSSPYICIYIYIKREDDLRCLSVCTSHFLSSNVKFILSKVRLAFFKN